MSSRVSRRRFVISLSSLAAASVLPERLALEPKQSATFKYRVLILSRTATPDDLEAQYRKFTDEVK